MKTRTLLLVLLSACAGDPAEAPAPAAPSEVDAPKDPVAEAEGLVPFGDPWEFCPDINDFKLSSPDGQALLGYVLVPVSPREGGRFQPGSQYWLRLNASQPLPPNFRLERMDTTAPQSALDRMDWEQQDNSLFDSQTSAGFTPLTPGPGDNFYEVTVTLQGEEERAAFLHRDVGGPPKHEWYGEAAGLAVEPSDPDLRVIKTEDVIQFKAAPQPAAGTSFLKTTDPA